MRGRGRKHLAAASTDWGLSGRRFKSCLPDLSPFPLSRLDTRNVHRSRRYDWPRTELHRQIDSMTEEEAAEVKLIYAPDWPSKATSIEEIRKRTGTRAMTSKESEEFWQQYGPLMQPPDGEG